MESRAVDDVQIPILLWPRPLEGVGPSVCVFNRKLIQQQSNGEKGEKNQLLCRSCRYLCKLFM